MRGRVIAGCLAAALAGCASERFRLVEIEGEGFRRTGFLAGEREVVTALLPAGRIARAATLFRGELAVAERQDLAARDVTVLRVATSLGLPPRAAPPREGPGIVYLWRAGLPSRYPCACEARDDGLWRVWVGGTHVGEDDRGAPVLQDGKVVGLLLRGLGWNCAVARTYGTGP